MKRLVITKVRMEPDQKMLMGILNEICEYPEEVKIDRRVDEMGVLLVLDLNKADMGKVIGRSGNTAKAIRTILRVVGMKNNARVNLKITEPEGGRPPADLPDRETFGV